jgi:predicted DCC family thiol-disulfide oxidoreductase YuxK
MAAAPVILFDGVCNFCAWSVRFVIAHDPAGVFRFASLQSEPGKALLRQHGLDENACDSFVMIQDGRAFIESTAALRVCKHLCWPWRWLQVILILPRFLRDPFYRIIARNRYRWFGKSGSCLVPSPEIRARFLN